MTYIHRNFVSGRRTCAIAQKTAWMIPNKASVLDVGCGNGKLASRLLALRPDLQIEGIDVNLVDNPTVPIHKYDGRQIPYGDGTWDVCLASDVLHHCDDPERVLYEMVRVARTAVILKDHYANSWLDFQILKLMDWAGNRGYGTALPYNFLSEREWKSLFDKLGLSPTHTDTDLNLYSYPLTWILDRRLHFISYLKRGA